MGQEIFKQVNDHFSFNDSISIAVFFPFYDDIGCVRIIYLITAF